MSANSGSRPFMAVLAALAMLLSAPLGAPAFANPGNVHVAAIPDSTELPAASNGGLVQEAGVTYGATPSTP
jgi:hypothetical protein